MINLYTMTVDLKARSGGYKTSLFVSVKLCNSATFQKSSYRHYRDFYYSSSKPLLSSCHSTANSLSVVDKKRKQIGFLR